MNISVFTYCTLLVSVFVLFVDYGEAKWCNETITTMETRYVNVTKKTYVPKDSVLCRLIWNRNQTKCLEIEVKIQLVPETYENTTVIPKCCLGYQLDLDSCSPICDPKCVNGECVGPKQCKCWAGLIRSQGPQNRHICEKFIGRNGSVKDGEFVCDSGYQKNKEWNRCTPICDPKCINGECVGPNQCNCSDGVEIFENFSFEA